MNTYDFGRFLAQLRKEKGLTQAQFAELLNVTDKAVSRWETGKNYPDIEMFGEISKVLGVTISELLEGKRMEQAQLFSVSEGHIVSQIKRNKRLKKVFLIVTTIMMCFAIWLGYLVLEHKGVFAGVIYKEIPCYSNDVITMMNNLDGYISQVPKAEGEFIIDTGFFFLEEDKTTNDILYLSGTCENGRAFYINSMYDEAIPKNSNCFIGEFREKQECVEGIAFHDLKTIVSQLDLEELPPYEKYELSLSHVDTYDKFQLNNNEHQKTLKKFVFLDGVLQRYEKDTISGKYLVIHVSGFNQGNGKGVADIFYKLD
ncbi:MAG: helix-turn-helix domain-containing protein [Firmicutes bacterium]|nr:helix-turn-helix domain-containing protein [Bacillota bacterium]